MERNDGERRLRFLQRAYLVFGLSVLPLSLACAVSGIDFLWRYFYGSTPQFLLILWLSTLLVSSILLILTSFGMKSLKGYTKLSGMGGNILLILSCSLALYITLNIMLNFVYYFPFQSEVTHPMVTLLELYAFISPISIIPVSIAIMVITFKSWKNLPTFRISRKVKLVSISSVTMAILVGGATIVVDEVQRCSALKGLEYVNENRWGFNPPEGWEEEANSSCSDWVSFYPPDEHGEVELRILYTRLPEGLQPINIEKVVGNVSERFRNLPSTHLVSHRSREINGMDAYEIVYTITFHGNTTKFKEIFVVKRNVILYMIYGAREEYYDIYGSCVEDSVKSLVIV